MQYWYSIIGSLTSCFQGEEAEIWGIFADRLELFLADQRDNAPVWVAVCLGLGSAIYFGLTFEPYAAITGLLAVASLGLFLWARRAAHMMPDSFARHITVLSAVVVFLMMVGFSCAQIETNWQGTPMVTRDTRPVKLTGILDHMELQEGNKGVLAIIGDVGIEGWAPDVTPHQVRLTIRKGIGPATVGDKITMLAKLTPPSPPVMPGGYDFQRHYYFEGIGALGFALSEIEVTEHHDGSGFFLTTLRHNIAQKIADAVPERQAGIVAALMTGERAAIYDEDWLALRVSGLAHIISISGLHVAMVAGPVFFLVRLLLACFPFIALHYPIKKIAAGAALFVACLYVGLVVPSVPTTRSLLMTGIVLIAVMMDRSPISLRLVAVSAILVLIFQPDSVWSASFQMSFAAVAALVAVAEATSPWLTRAYADAGPIKKGALWVAGSLMTSLVASLATAPFSLYHFGQVATYSVFANFVSIPITGLIIMPMLMVSFILMPFGAEGWSLRLMGKGVEWLLDVARYTEGMPHAQIMVATAPFAFLVSAVLAGMCLLFLRGRARLVFVVPLAVMFAALIVKTPPDIFVSGDGRVMAVRAEGALQVSSVRRNKFVTDSWRKHLGLRPEEIVPFPVEGIKDNISCGGDMCRLTLSGHKIAYGERQYELHQDCDWADVIITSAHTSKYFCGKELHVTMIDNYFLRHEGAASISFDGDAINLRTVRRERGVRPWSDDVGFSDKTASARRVAPAPVPDPD